MPARGTWTIGPPEEVAAQNAFDSLNEPAPASEEKQKASIPLGRVEDLKLDQRYEIERN